MGKYDNIGTNKGKPSDRFLTKKGDFKLYDKDGKLITSKANKQLEQSEE